MNQSGFLNPPSGSPITEDDLHAYADGQLDAERQFEVAAWLQRHPEAQAKIAHWQAQSLALHSAFDRVLDEAIPASQISLLRQVRLNSSSHWHTALWRYWLWPTVTASLGLLLGLGFARAPQQESLFKFFSANRATVQPQNNVQQLVQGALLAHATYAGEKRHPVEVVVAEKEHLISWLSKRLGKPLHAPDLTANGFELLGGRLLPATADNPGNGVAQFMYQNAAGQRLTLYVKPSPAKQPPQTAFAFTQQDKLNMFYWIDGPLGYALSGEISKTELQSVADQVYQQLETKTKDQATE